MTACVACNEPLKITVPLDNEDEDDDAMTDDAPDSASYEVPDDVHLACNCHFHWACLLDSYELSSCPHCARDIVSAPPASSSSTNPSQQILVDINNEGGMQSQIDIYPILREESYLRAYPDERRCRAFLELCREGDHHAIVDLLQSSAEDEDSETQRSPDEILRYQDSLGDGASGLHLAAANGHREVAWLLLLLASQVPELDFPALVYQEAAALGIMREDQTGKVDIRSLRDAHGQTAEDIARETGVIWNGWIGNGRLAMP